MRITRSMMVNNMLYWTEKQMEKLNDVSNIVASGKQINKPSDDPAAASEILSDRSTLSSCGQYQSNITQAETWIKASSTTLEAVDSYLDQAQEIMSSLATADTETVAGYLASLKNIYDQVLSLANSKYGSGYMYSGSVSNVAPFSDSVANDGVTQSGFYLEAAAADVTITIMNSSGEVVRTLTTDDDGITVLQGKNTFVWDGCDDSGATLSDDDYKFIVTAVDSAGDSVVAHTYGGDNGGKTVITGENSSITLNNNGGEIFGKALSVLSRAINAIQTSNVNVDLGDAFDDAFADIQAEAVSLSNINAQLEYKNDHLEKLMTNAYNRISDLEVGSKEEWAIKLQAQQTNYDVTLEAVANVLKMTKLSDLL